MKRIIILLAAFWTVGMSAQTAERYEQRYDLLVSQFGPAGVGVETVLDRWAEVDSTNAKMLFARFRFLFTKAQTTSVVVRPEKKYLGMEPLLSLKDSLGNDAHYYQVNDFDDELYGLAIKTLDRAIVHHPDRLDFRCVKANAYIAYEKDSPDMALAYLMDLADANARRAGRQWVYELEKVDDAFFADAMQEYCYSFYSIGSPASMKAFRALSEKMLALYPDNVEFMNNIGSYHMIAEKDYKAALKVYSKVLKKKPHDYIAIKNSSLAARQMGNVKLEKKYLALLAEHGPEEEQAAAQHRLKVLETKKK